METMVLDILKICMEKTGQLTHSRSIQACRICVVTDAFQNHQNYCICPYVQHGSIGALACCRISTNLNHEAALNV